MGKLSTVLTSVALLAASLYPGDAGAQTMLRTDYTIGDILGETTDWSKAVQNYYDVDGNLIRQTQLAQAPDGSEITLSNYWYYTYDENGRLVEKLETRAQATSSENADHEYVFNPTNKYIYIYNEEGLLVEEYYNMWRSSSNAFNDAKVQRHVYEYNEDGTLKTDTQWGNYAPTATNPEPKPNNVSTYTYADGLKVKMSNTGQYDSNKYDVEYTYDNAGRLVHSLTTNTSGNYAGKAKEENEYTYDGDFLAQSLTTKYSYSTKNGEIVVSETLSRVVYTKLNGDPNSYNEMKETYKKDTDTWTKSSTSHNYYKQSYADAGLYLPTVTVAKSGEDTSDVNISFTLKAVPTEAFCVKLYRDGYTIATLDKTALEAALQDGKYVYVDKGLVNGEHEYFVQVVTGTDAVSVDAWIDGYISNIAKIEVAKDYPVVTNFVCNGYILTNTWTAPSEDEELGHVEGYWAESLSLELEWTPLTVEQVEGLGFERYDIYVRGLSGTIPLTSIEDITTSSLTIDWRRNYTEVWVSAKYGEQRAESEHLTIDLATVPNISPVTPVPVYGVVYYGGFTPAFVKADLSAPAAATETVYNLWEDSKADLNNIKGGVTVGNSYYALVEDGNYDVFLGAFDMTNKKYATIGSALTVSLNDLAYDASAGVLYGVAPGARRSTLYTVDTATGVITETVVPVPANTYYIASDGAGKLYALAAVDGKFNFYTIDLAAETYVQDTDIVLDGKASTWSSLVYDTTAATKMLYFTNDKTLYTINPANKAVWKEPVALKQALSGIVFAMSSELPEVEEPAAQGRVIAKHITATGIAEYYYNLNSKLARVVESSETGVVRLTKNSFNEAGEISTSEVYEPVADEFGLSSMKLVASVENTYNADGKLEKTANSDGTWVSYTYNAYGNIETETRGNGETVSATLVYNYENENDNLPMYIMTDNGVIMLQYDEAGHKFREVYTTDPLGGVLASMEEWTYFEGTDIVSTHTIYDCSGEAPQIGRVIKYMMLDEKGMVLMAQAFDANDAPIEGSEEHLVYADLSENSARLGAMELAVENDAENVNTAKVKFTVPMLLYSEYVSPVVNVYRDGVQIDQLGLDRLAQLMSVELDEQLIVYTDAFVANGEHEYFVQAQDDIAGLQISNIAEIEFNTELPAVTEVNYVSNETKYTDAEGNITEETSGTPVKVVTIGWRNPEYPAEYGFISNNTFIVDEAPVAGEVVTDAAATKATVNFGTADKASVMVQTRYKLGVANSEVTFIDLDTTGVSNVTTADGISISLVNKVVKVSTSAEIRVFDAAGKLVAGVQGAELNLSHLNGSYLVAVNCNGAVKVLKVAL